MKTAVIQMNSSGDKRRNIEKALSFLHAAAGRKARFILLPEVFNYRGGIKTKQDLRMISEEIPGVLRHAQDDSKDGERSRTKSLRPFLDAARKSKAFVLAGSIYEKGEGSQKVYNTSALISPEGKVIAKYRKIHLFDAILKKKAIRESDFFLAGKKIVIARIEQFNVGMSICYDLRFPELYRACARLGAHVLCVPSAFTKITGQVHWEVLLKARAIENLCYVLAPNQTGTDARGIEAFGHSLIISPWGEILARASATAEEIIFADLSLPEVQKARRVFPSVQRSRFGVVREEKR